MWREGQSLNRFIEAQNHPSYGGQSVYENALSEIRAGQKESHWMWFIFPQILGLGESETSQFYGIRGLEEATQYQQHPVLGARLVEICEALLPHANTNISNILGWPDDMKLKSSLTLFAQSSAASPVFMDVLNRFFDGTPDEITLEILRECNQNNL